MLFTFFTQKVACDQAINGGPPKDPRQRPLESELMLIDESQTLCKLERQRKPNGNCSTFELTALHKTKIANTLPISAAERHFSPCLLLFLDFNTELFSAGAVFHTALLHFMAYKQLD